MKKLKTCTTLALKYMSVTLYLESVEFFKWVWFAQNMYGRILLCVTKSCDYLASFDPHNVIKPSAGFTGRLFYR
jgi:hypothetical protein